jgi:hypothetical protein
MRFTFLLITLLLQSKLNAQQFSSTILFTRQNTTDTDSLVIGYDPNATDTLDALFNELNILQTPRDSAFDVRIGNVWGLLNIGSYNGQTPYQTRRQIMQWRCGSNELSVIELNIKSNKWPVYVNWVRSDFQDSCRTGTSLTNMHPLQWWNGQGFREELSIWNYHPIYPSQWSIIDGNDTLYTYWIGMGNDKAVISSTDDIAADEDIKIYPNPASDYFSITSLTDLKIDSVEVYSADGRLVLTSTDIRVNIQSLSNGIYSVMAYDKSGFRLKARLIKCG